jgi:Cu(I)/Ag(I) efflux system periplasmic protein CusF
MKRSIKLFAVITFTTVIFIFACSKNEVSDLNSNTPQNIEKQTYKSIGVVKSIDVDAGKITVDHEEIPGYMSAMEMTEAVSDAKMLETVKIGDKVELDLERTGSKLVITKLTKIGEVAIINGGEIYKMNCATCHGGLGEGDKKGISLLKGHALNHTEAEYVEQVTNGEGKKMPAFKDKLSAEQITAVVKFVREDLQKDVSEEERKSHKH